MQFTKMSKKNAFGTHFDFLFIQAISIIYLILQGSQVKSLAFIFSDEFTVTYNFPYFPDRS